MQDPILAKNPTYRVVGRFYTAKGAVAFASGLMCEHAVQSVLVGNVVEYRVYAPQGQEIPCPAGTEILFTEKYVLRNLTCRSQDS